MSCTLVAVAVLVLGLGRASEPDAVVGGPATDSPATAGRGGKAAAGTAGGAMGIVTSGATGGRAFGGGATGGGAFGGEPALVLPQRIEAQLRRRVSLDFRDRPLREVVEHLRTLTGVPISLDRKSLEDLGLSEETTITFHGDDVSLASALAAMLRSGDLSYSIVDEALVIASREVCESYLVTKVYPVQDLMQGTLPFGYDFDDLIHLVTTIVAPPTWDGVGGPGSIKGFDGTLVVSQTTQVQAEIEALLATIRELVRRQHEPSPSGVTFVTGSLAVDEARHGAIRAALNQPSNLEFRDVPLSDVAQRIQRDYGIPVRIDQRALNDLQLKPDMAVSVDVPGVSLGSALRHVLRPHYLAWTVANESLVFTSREFAEASTRIRVYPVRDLLEDRHLPGDKAADLVAWDLLDPPRDWDGLITVITTTVRPASWDGVGGPGTVKQFTTGGLMVIAQTDDVHQEIEALLARLRQHSNRGRAAVELANDAGDRDGEFQLRVYRIARWAVGETPTHPETQLADMVRKLVEPESWTTEPQAYIQDMPSRLVIRHRGAVQRRIHRLLSDLGAMYRGDDEE